VTTPAETPTLFAARSTRIDGRTSLIALEGDVDLHTSSTFRGHVLGAIAGGSKRVVVDLTETTFFDSTALGVLVGARKRLAAVGGELSVVVSDHNTLRVFEVTGLDRIVSIYPTVAAATGAGPDSSPG
jgi:anti-sigma B factor antagonist